jgi:outer membrane protein OmpA-like peptidoglycan-associated protein
MALTRPAKLVLFAIGGGGLVFGINYFRTHGDAKMASVDLKTVQGGNLTHFNEDTNGVPSTGAVLATELPTTTPAALNSPPFKIVGMKWNAQFGLLTGIGGKAPTKGSLAEKYGVNVTFENINDYSVMQAGFVACATELKQGATSCSNGNNFAIIMGDAGAQFFDGLNTMLKAKVGPEWAAEGVFAAGRSAGEDKCMLPPEMKADPQKARGAVIAAVIKDGDWNICIHWAKKNGLCNNPDVTSWDPNCLNWVGTDSFEKADDAFIAGTCESRPVVKLGKKTGDTNPKVCVNGVATWTPGDQVVASRKGGVVSVMSTKENDAQMPALVIGLKKWDADNRTTVKNLMKVVFEGSNLVKRGGRALMRAGQASVEAYGSDDAGYWVKYYNGSTDLDATGAQIALGGSKAWNLADNLRYFGLAGGRDLYADTYTLFGNYAKANYPADLPSFPPVSEIMNKSFLTELAAEGEFKGTAETPTFDPNSAGGETVGQQDFHINFETGSYTFSSDAAAPLNDMLQGLVVSGNTVVEIHGYTDSSGTPEGNMTLSQNRAAAVKAYLVAKTAGTFPPERFKVIPHGQNNPACTTGKTPECFAANRRVRIVLKSNG